jgi:hypothetical protein
MCFPGVRCQLQLYKDPVDDWLGVTDSSIRSLATVFWWETRTGTWTELQGKLECIQ